MSEADPYKAFETRVFAILAKLGKQPVFWNSVYDSGVAIPAGGAVVHSYQGGVPAIAAIAKAGHKVISSGLGGYYVASQSSWEKIYLCRGAHAGWAHGGGAGQCAGWGERHVGETMDDSDIDTIVWPDTAAVAERLWSSPKSADNSDAYDAGQAALRLIPHRCRLLQRGIRAKPIHDCDGFGRRRLQAGGAVRGHPARHHGGLPAAAVGAAGRALTRSSSLHQQPTGAPSSETSLNK